MFFDGRGAAILVRLGTGYAVLVVAINLGVVEDRGERRQRRLERRDLGRECVAFAQHAPDDVREVQRDDAIGILGPLGDGFLGSLQHRARREEFLTRVAAAQGHVVEGVGGVEKRGDGVPRLDGQLPRARQPFEVVRIARQDAPQDAPLADSRVARVGREDHADVVAVAERPRQRIRLAHRAQGGAGFGGQGWGAHAPPPNSDACTVTLLRFATAWRK